MNQRTLSLLSLFLFAGLAFASADTNSSSSSSSTSSSSTNCSSLCDPMTGGNQYKDAAYSKTYSPCVSEAARQGTTAKALRCEEKATRTCMSMCQD